MAQYRKKPVVVEAVQFTGNDEDAIKFCPDAYRFYKSLVVLPSKRGMADCYKSNWIVKEGDSYEVYTDEDFHATYEPIQQTTDPLITEGC